MSGFLPVEERLPTTSDVLIKTFFTKSDTGEKPRDITEMQPATIQGTNAKILADYVVKQTNAAISNPANYIAAVNFKSHYDANLCYICGGEINKDVAGVEELEHLLPIAEALTFGLIIQDNKKVFEKQCKEIHTNREARGYLLEYARSHRCCNQLKGSTSLLIFDGRPPYENPYKINGNSISSLLKQIWDNTTSPNGKYGEANGCKNEGLVNHLKTFKNKEQFITTRKQVLIDQHFQPLLNFINEAIQESGQGSFRFAQLVFISNQAMSIDPKVWKLLGSRWSGDIVTKEEMIRYFLTESRNVTYKNSNESAIQTITSNDELSVVVRDYYTSRKKSSRPVRTVDVGELSRYLNAELNVLKQMHFKYLNGIGYESILTELGYNVNNNTMVPENYCFFGYEYVHFLINSQSDDFKFYDSMKTPLLKLMQNINEYTICFMYLCIIMFDIINYKGAYAYKLDSLNELTVINGKLTKYFQIHEGIVNDFTTFNFLINVRDKFRSAKNPSVFVDFTP